MKIKSLLLCLFSLLLLSSCGKKTVISGNVQNAENELLELALNTEPKKVTDTLRLKSDGDFSFKYDFKKSTLPVFLSLSVSNIQLGTLLLEPGEKVTIGTDLKNPANYSVTGSRGSELLKELNDRMLAASVSTDSLIKILEANEDSEEESKRLNRELALLYTKYKQYLIRFVIKNSNSYAAYTALYQGMPNGIKIFGKANDAIYFKLLADSLETKYARSSYVSQLRDDHKKLLQLSNLQSLIDNVEETSIPEIEMPDVTGKKTSLSSLKGKLILLDFWASTERATAMNNIDILSLYEKYNAQGFDVFQISLDTNREQWARTINTQKLPWANVCDFRGSKTSVLGLYNVTKIPANYLISKDWEIIGKDLFGEELEKKIKDALK